MTRRRWKTEDELSGTLNVFYAGRVGDVQRWRVHATGTVDLIPGRPIHPRRLYNLYVSYGERLYEALLDHLTLASSLESIAQVPACECGGTRTTGTHSTWCPASSSASTVAERY